MVYRLCSFWLNRGKPAWALLGSFLVILTFIFRATAGRMIEAWQTGEYGHGALIPLLALALLLNKKKPEGLKAESSWLGFFVIIFCLLGYFFLTFAAVKGFLPQAFLVSFIGVFVLFYGPRMAWFYKGPLLFLLFAAPLPNFFYYATSVHMQVMSTSLGVWFLNLVGIPVYQEGNLIDLGTYKLQVVEACNGLRYLFPLISLSFLFAYFYKTSFAKRLVLFLSAIPLTLLMNSFRIAIIGITVNVWGQKMADGFIHDFEGWIIFAACFLALLLEIKLMQKVGTPGHLSLAEIRLPSFRSWPAPVWGRGVKATAILLFLAGAVSAAWPSFLEAYKAPVPPQAPLRTFTLYLGEWIGHPGELSEKEKTLLAADEYILIDYTNPKNERVNLYALYYPKQDVSSNQAQHRPTLCLPGGGWSIENQREEIIIGENLSPFPVNRLVASKDGQRLLLYFWYIQNGKNIANPNLSKLATLRNALLLKRTNGAMVRYTTPLLPSETEADADNRLKSFIKLSFGPLTNQMFGP